MTINLSDNSYYRKDVIAIGNVLIASGSSGGITSEDVTATRGDILKGTTAITSDSNDEVVEGTLSLTGNAGVANVEKGKTFYNTNAKSKQTGTLRNVTNDSTIDHTSNNATPVVTGDAAYISTNSDNVARAQIRFNSTRGVIEPNTLIGIEQSKMASAGGLTAAKLMKNQSAFGIAGTATSDATANAADILTGKTAYKNGSKITGTMATLAGGTYTANNTTQTISCSGKKMTSNIIINPASKITNLTAANIKKGVTIAGITGTWEGYVATATDIYYNGVRNYGFNYKGTSSHPNATWNTASCNAYLNGKSYYFYTTQAINLTAYTGVKVKISNDYSNGGTGGIYITIGASSSSIGSNAGNMGTGSSGKTVSLGKPNSPVTYNIPFTTSHALSSTIGLYVVIYSGASTQTVYQVSLY